MKTIFGTMNIGQQVFEDDAVEMLGMFKEAGGSELDTAYVYNDGECEAILGKCLKRFDAGFSLATKANPRVTGRLDKASVIAQLDRSLERLGVSSVGIFFLHFPDESTPIRSALEGCAKLHEQGKFEELGVSNFPLSLVEEMLPVCDELGCPRPTVFEGVYNALSRKAEEVLLPSLSRFGIRFHAYNPLAGGMLTGKYKSLDAKPNEGRFALRARSYQERYWKKSYFDAVGFIVDACSRESVPVAEAALRWIAKHSMLDESRGDAVIVGASKIEQLEQNLAALKADFLPEQIVAAMDDAWGMVADEAPEYYRFYRSGEAVV